MTVTVNITVNVKLTVTVTVTVNVTVTVTVPVSVPIPVPDAGSFYDGNVYNFCFTPFSTEYCQIRNLLHDTILIM